MRIKFLEALGETRDGHVWYFVYWDGNITINIDDRPHAQIVDVPIEDFVKEVENFLEMWEQANPHTQRLHLV